MSHKSLSEPLPCTPTPCRIYRVFAGPVRDAVWIFSAEHRRRRTPNVYNNNRKEVPFAAGSSEIEGGKKRGGVIYIVALPASSPSI